MAYNNIMEVKRMIDELKGLIEWVGIFVMLYGIFSVFRLMGF